MVCPSGLTSSDIQVPLLVVNVAYRSGTRGRPGFGIWADPAIGTAASRRSEATAAAARAGLALAR